MKNRIVPGTLIATLLLALSTGALAWGRGDGLPRPDHRAFHDAVLSGALTDAELATLKQERETLISTVSQLREDGDFSSADREQARKLAQALQDKTRTLIDNADRTQKRDKLPEDLMPPRGMGKGGHDCGPAGHHGGDEGKRGDRHDRRGERWHGRPGMAMPGAEMKQFRDAVISGALTDKELLTLKQERDKLLDSARQSQQRPDFSKLQALTKTLINNKDRTAARTSWPDELVPWGDKAGR